MPKEGVLRDQALRLDKSSLTIADECLRFRFVESADLVALMASHGDLAYPEVLDLVRSMLAGERDVDDATERLDAYALSSLMRTVAGQHASGPLMQADFAEAADLARAARMLKGDVKFSATAARMSAFNAFSSILSPSWKSMARLVLPSRLELKRPEGSSNEAPLAKVIFTEVLYVSPVQMIPACDHTGTPLHFHSSTTSGSACLMTFRT